MSKKIENYNQTWEILKALQMLFIGISHKSMTSKDLKVHNVDPQILKEIISIIQFTQQDLPLIRLQEKGTDYIVQVIATDKAETIKRFNETFKEGKRPQPLTFSSAELQQRATSRSFLEIVNLPKLVMQFQCKKCGEVVDYPRHCDEEMRYDLASNKLICAACGFQQNIPRHCNETMQDYCHLLQPLTTDFRNELIKAVKKPRQLDESKIKSQESILLQLKKELLEKAKKERIIDEEKIQRLTSRQIKASFVCTVCKEKEGYPWHCHEPMDLDIDNKQFKCNICGEIKSFPPVHCDKEMNLVVNLNDNS